ncbi:hypothetical protein H131_04309 [Lysinibacillus sphaericus OT4b.31]|uniref:Uncharacterized protein n=1 Tax=Lysinibacillus sphaericus OT4b.31 TaxID=1285586 RepID=R7ZIB3_LYSSH|nr:hypothetical protein H131_04309 [Lysinibacillus sphaericus OT4b.31]
MIIIFDYKGIFFNDAKGERLLNSHYIDSSTIVFLVKSSESNPKKLSILRGENDWLFANIENIERTYK